MADIITIPMQPLNIYGELVTENGIEVKNAASISVGTDTITVPMHPVGYGTVLITVKLCPYPIPAISADKTAGCAPLQVAFSSTASEFLIDQLWTLGSGVTSADANPSHEYTAGGDYAIALTGYNQAGARQTTGTIHVLDPPIAGFEASATSGTSPVTIDFTAVCTGDIDNYDWDFGDGATSGDQFPSHTYTTGTYDVSLIASNPYCSDELVLADYIVVESGEPTYQWVNKTDTSYWTGNTDYACGDQAVWDGTYWSPTGNGGGDVVCLRDVGTWVTGYRPLKVRVTSTGGASTVFLFDSSMSFIAEGNVNSEIDITFGGNDIHHIEIIWGSDTQVSAIEFYEEV